MPAADPLLALGELPGVPEAVESARVAVDRLRGHRVLRRSAPAVSAESALRGARAAALLELGRGADGGWPLAQVRAAVRGSQDVGRGLVGITSAGPGDPGEPDVQVLRGALRLSAELGPLLPTWRRAPLQALARAHLVAAADLVTPDELGRPRGPAQASSWLPLGPAPSPDEVAARLDGLAQLLEARTQAPALVVAAVVHAELLVVRPFTRANVVVALGAQRLALVTLGLDPGALSAPEVGHLTVGPAAYGAAVRGYATGTPGGVAGWLRHVAEAVELGAREGVAVCEAIQRGG